MARPTLSVTIAALGLLLVPGALLLAQKREPVPSDEEQKRLIEEGIVLHDNQEFEAAAAKYQEALRRNPDNLRALFELTSLYYEMGEHRKSLEAALRGAEYRSEDLGYFYVMIGTNYDLLKQPGKAEKAYREGLVHEPGSYLLHYNLGVTYLSTRRIDPARESFKQALRINPRHAGSHVGLGQIYFARGYRVPALLAFGRALELEPLSGRAESLLGLVEQLLGTGKNGDGAIPVAGEREDEGEFRAAELVLAREESPRSRATMDAVVAKLKGVCAALAALDTASLKRGFAAGFYVPYYAQLARRDLVEPFAYHIFQSLPREGAAEWMRANEARLKEFRQWTLEYR